MKLKNIFKKTTKTVVKSGAQTLDKKQLEKVIGGADKLLAHELTHVVQQGK